MHVSVTTLPKSAVELEITLDADELTPYLTKAATAL